MRAADGARERSKWKDMGGSSLREVHHFALARTAGAKELGLSDLPINWDGATELAERSARKLLETTAAEPARDAVVRFLAGRSEGPRRGAFASLAPSNAGERLLPKE